MPTVPRHLDLTVAPDRVDDPATIARIEIAARLVGGQFVAEPAGRSDAITVEASMSDLYGRTASTGEILLRVAEGQAGVPAGAASPAGEAGAVSASARTVVSLDAGAAAAVAGWYLIHGSSEQALALRPELRRPALLLVGDDREGVGSGLRSAAAFGWRDVLLDDRAGWFQEFIPSARERAGGARRQKNSLRVHRASIESGDQFDEVLVVTPAGPGSPLQDEHLTRGQRQLIVVGAEPVEFADVAVGRVRLASLGLTEAERMPLWFGASVVAAEIARQIGRRRAPVPRKPGVRAARYERLPELETRGEFLLVEPSQLLEF